MAVTNTIATLTGKLVAAYIPTDVEADVNPAAVGIANVLLDGPELHGFLNFPVKATGQASEPVTVPGSPFQYTLLGGAGIVGNPVVVMIVAGVPTTYTIVANGSEVSHVSCSITAGVLKFAAADAGLTGTATYTTSTAFPGTIGDTVTIVITQSEAT